MAVEVARTITSDGLCLSKAKGWVDRVQIWELRDVVRLSAPFYLWFCFPRVASSSGDPSTIRLPLSFLQLSCRSELSPN